MKKLIALLSSLSLVGTAGVAGIATVACGSSSSHDDQDKIITKWAAISGDREFTNLDTPTPPAGIKFPYPKAILEQFKKAMDWDSMTDAEEVALEKVMPLYYTIEFKAKPSFEVNSKTNIKSKSVSSDSTNSFTIPISRFTELAEATAPQKGVARNQYFENDNLYKSPSYNYINHIKNIQLKASFKATGDDDKIKDYKDYYIKFNKMYAKVTIPTAAAVTKAISDKKIAETINAKIAAAKNELKPITAPLELKGDARIVSPFATINFNTNLGKDADFTEMLYNRYKAYKPPSEKEMQINVFKKFIYSATINHLTDQTSKKDDPLVAISIKFKNKAVAQKGKGEAVSPTDDEFTEFQNFINNESQSNGWNVDLAKIQDGTTYTAISTINAPTPWEWKDEYGFEYKLTDKLGFVKANIGRIQDNPAGGLAHSVKGKDLLDAVIKAMKTAFGISGDLTYGELADFNSIITLLAKLAPSEEVPTFGTDDRVVASRDITSGTESDALHAVIRINPIPSNFVAKSDFGAKLINELYTYGVTTYGGEVHDDPNAHITLELIQPG